jgi:histidinol-phosphate aminotransferase
MMKTTTPSIFKPTYLPKAGGYKGGKSLSEVKAKIGKKKLYKLSSNENYLGASPKAKKAIRAAINDLGLYPERTDVHFRKALSDFYGGILTPDQFVTDNSGVALLEMVERAFLNPGDEVIICNPAFKPYYMFAGKLGAKAIDVPMVGKNYDLDIQGILKAITKRTKLLFLCSPNNPTGTHIPQGQLDELLPQIPAHVVTIYDEVYYQYADAEDFTIGLPYVKAGLNVIAVNSFSKAYGLAGLRVGYGYTTEEIGRYLAQVRRPFHINTLSMDAAQAALKDKSFIKKTVSLVHEEKKYLYKALDKLGVKYWKTQANFITIKPKMNDKKLEEAMLMQGVMVRPVANFGAKDCIRVTIGDREANKAYIKALKKVLK